MSDSRTGEVEWFEPKVRGVLELDSLKVSRSLRQSLKQSSVTVKHDTNFRQVVHSCAESRAETWISHEIEEAYVRLHEVGFAHCVEVYDQDLLVGGLYGVGINGVFFGESMFHVNRDASKIALVSLVGHLNDRGYELLDTQYITPHLETLGGTEISREEYRVRLSSGLSKPVAYVDGGPYLDLSGQLDEFAKKIDGIVDK